MRIIVLCFLVMLLTSSAMGWPPAKDDAEQAGVKLLSMQKSGHVKVDMESQTVAVEPLDWKGFTNKDKVDFTTTALTFFSGHPPKKGQSFVFIRDMTSRDVLATGFLDSGKVEIKR